MHNQTLIKNYNFTNRINKHPYDTILNLEEFKKICHNRFLKSVICKDAPNDKNFYKIMVYDFIPMADVEQIENTINNCKAKNNIDYKFYYCYFWHSPFESIEEKENIINSMQQKELPNIYYYDLESKTGNIMPMDDLHKIINFVLELTPQQWFDKYNNEYLSQIFNDDAIQELKAIFLNMPNDAIETEPITLFDDPTTYVPTLKVIESKEHKFFEILLMNLDIFANTENNINNYYEFLQHIYLETFQNEHLKECEKLDEIKRTINELETNNAVETLNHFDIDKIKNKLENISCLDIINSITTEKIIKMVEQETKEIEETKEHAPYLYYMALKQFVNDEIETVKKRIKEVQKQMSNCNVIGTDEHFINEKITQYLMQIKRNDIINIDIVNATNKRVINDVYLLDPFARNWKNIYDNGAKARNNNVILSNQKQYGIVGNMQFGIETFESQKQFNFDYMALYSALVGYWMTNGTTPFTTRQLYENYMSKDDIKHASVDMMQWINNAILDMAKSWFALNGITKENANYNKEGYFLPIEPIDNEIIINGFKFNTIEYKNKNPFNRVWRLLKAPLLYDVSIDNGTMVYTHDKHFLEPTPKSNLPTPNINSPTVITIRQQLKQLLLGIKNGTIKKREFVLRDFLTINCGIGERSKKQIDAMKNVIKQYLDIATENGIIKKYEFKKSTKNKNYISFFIISK